MKGSTIIAAAALAVGVAGTAQAGIGAEAMGARADGHWGGELGAGYALGLGGFSITPGAGVLVADGYTRAYGRVEAAYQIPAVAKIGAGVRISGDHTRPYGTVALPLAPMFNIKGNVGPQYYAVGLTFGY